MPVPNYSNLIPGLGAIGAAAGLPAQVQKQALTTRGLLPGDTAALSPQLLSMLQGAFGTGAGNLGKPSALPPLDDMGLYAGQRSGFDEAVKQAASQFSGNMAGRGFISPENTGAIAGSAAQQVMPQFAPLIGENMRNSVLMPEQIQQNRFANLLNAINSGTNALGAKSTEEGFYPSFATTLGKSLLDPGTGSSLLGTGLQQVLNLPGNLLQGITRLFGNQQTDPFAAVWNPNTSTQDLINLGNQVGSPIPGFGNPWDPTQWANGLG